MGEPAPKEIYNRANTEGERRLSMPPMEQVSTGFIAGITIVFGIIALAMAEHLVEPALGAGPAKLAGALAFGMGLVFLIIGRSELFPVAYDTDPYRPSQGSPLADCDPTSDSDTDAETPSPTARAVPPSQAGQRHVQVENR